MKDEALKLALEALETELVVDITNGAEVGEAAELMCEAITAIKQALAAPVQSCYCPNCEAMGKELAALKAQPEPVQEPVAWKWHQAPVKTSWGHDMVVADLAIDKDNTVSVYCERDQTTKVEAMFNPPAAQRPDVDALVALARADEREACAKVCDDFGPTLANGAMLAEAIRERGNA